jgi:hypothetical protein
LKKSSSGLSQSPTVAGGGNDSIFLIEKSYMGSKTNSFARAIYTLKGAIKHDGRMDIHSS